jgi:hypothetical protein
LGIVAVADGAAVPDLDAVAAGMRAESAVLDAAVVAVRS